MRLESSSGCRDRGCTPQLAWKRGLQRDTVFLTTRKSSLLSVSLKANLTCVENKEAAGWVSIFNILKSIPFLKYFFFFPPKNIRMHVSRS